MPGPHIQEHDLQRDGREPDREDRENSARLRVGPEPESLAHSTIAKEKPHRPENRSQRVDIDQDRGQHRPTNENRDAIFEPVTPAPRPMSAPKNSKHDDARHERGHMPEGAQQFLDIIRDLISSDH